MHSLPRRAHPDYTLRFTLPGETNVQKATLSQTSMLENLEAAQQSGSFMLVVVLAKHC